MNNLYEFYWDCGRSGDLMGLFIATQEEVDNLINKEVWFGEALGKHSEVYGTIAEGEITKLDVSQQTVDELYKVVGRTISGYNPLEYYEEYSEGERD